MKVKKLSVYFIGGHSDNLFKLAIEEFECYKEICSRKKFRFTESIDLLPLRIHAMV